MEGRGESFTQVSYHGLVNQRPLNSKGCTAQLWVKIQIHGLLHVPELTSRSCCHPGSWGHLTSCMSPRLLRSPHTADVTRDPELTSHSWCHTGSEVTSHSCMSPGLHCSLHCVSQQNYLIPRSLKLSCFLSLHFSLRDSKSLGPSSRCTFRYWMLV